MYTSPGSQALSIERGSLRTPTCEAPTEGKRGFSPFLERERERERERELEREPRKKPRQSLDGQGRAAGGGRGDGGERTRLRDARPERRRPEQGLESLQIPLREYAGLSFSGRDDVLFSMECSWLFSTQAWISCVKWDLEREPTLKEQRSSRRCVWGQVEHDALAARRRGVGRHIWKSPS